MKNLKNQERPTSRKAEAFDEPLEIADFDIFERGLGGWLRHTYAALKEMPPERIPNDFEEYLVRAEAHLERCERQLWECKSLFSPKKFEAIAEALGEIRTKIPAREIDPKLKDEFDQIRKKVIVSKTT